MKISVIFIFTCFLCSCSNVETTEDYYRSGELKKVSKKLENGLVYSEEFYKAGSLKCEMYERNGFLEGKVISYFGNGDTMSVVDYKNGIEDGEALFYSEGGKIHEKSFVEFGEKYYSIFYNVLGGKTKEMIRPIARVRNKMKKNISSFIDVNLPFDQNTELPYLDNEIKILWCFSKLRGTDQFVFDEKRDSLIILNKNSKLATIEVTPRDTGRYFLNQLLYFNMKDSLFKYIPIEFQVD